MSPTDSGATLIPEDQNTIRIIPLGGCGEFGMNMTAYICSGKLFVVDCGVMFPDPMKLGVEAVIPKVHEIFKQCGGVYAWVITHGHDDHIGALPYLIDKYPAPMYATPWTAELIQNRFNRKGIGDRHPITVVEPGDHVTAEGFDAEYVAVNHSIPHACALFIRTPQMNIFHTGDFRIDDTPVIEEPISRSLLRKIGDEGVHLLLADSTNAQKKGIGPSESSVKGPLGETMDNATGAVVITTFSSNFWRIKQIVDLCIEKGRKLLILGPGVEASFAAAAAVGMYRIPDGVRVDESQARHVPRKELVVIATGSQGEYRSAMMRISLGEHKAFKIQDGDVVVFSSRMIPGNERTAQMMMAKLEKLGARIITTRQNPGIHVSGHAFSGEIAELMRCLRPKQFIPIHGTFSHLHANELIPAEHQLKDTKSYTMENGDVMDVTKTSVKRFKRIDPESEFIDSESYVPIAYETLRERLRIGELGMAIIGGVFSMEKKDFVHAPVITIQGLAFPHTINGKVWLEEASMYVAEAVITGAKTGVCTPESVNEDARVTMRRHLSGMFGKKPVVLTNLFVI